MPGWAALLLPCSGTLRLRDYSLSRTWRVVLGDNWDLVSSGLVEVYAVDSCKPGLVQWGDEYRFSWCDLKPYWDYYRVRPWRFDALVEGLRRDLRELAARQPRAIVTYIHVKAYRLALDKALGELPWPPVVRVDPDRSTVLGFMSRRSRERLRSALLDILGVRSIFDGLDSASRPPQGFPGGWLGRR